MTQKYRERIAVYPGTFDPFTIGHLSIVERGLLLFDKIIVAVGINDNKRCFQPIEKRVASIQKVLRDDPRIDVVSYDGLTVDIETVLLYTLPELQYVSSTMVRDLDRCGYDISQFVPGADPNR